MLLNGWILTLFHNFILAICRADNIHASMGVMWMSFLIARQGIASIALVELRTFTCTMRIYAHHA